MAWNRLSLLDRIHWMRFVLPPVLALWVITYQLAFAQPLEAAYGHTVHYGVEIAFYSLAGPVVTWVTLTWVEHRVSEKEQLEAQVQQVAQERAAVLEEERARIARDLHDGVAQTLYFLALKADMLRGQLQTDPVLAKDLREMGQTARKVIRDVRRTIFALHPLDWGHGGFLTGLRQFVAGFAEQAGWRVADAIDDRLVTPSSLEPLLFRLIQESLNNVAKHAEASQVWVALSAEADGRSLRLTIRDDGLGFEPQAAHGHGLGLQQMAKRARAAGGIFQVESGKGQGTAITVHIPIGEELHE